MIRETTQTRSRPGYKETIHARVERQKEDPSAIERQRQKHKVQENMQKHLDRWEQGITTDQELIRAIQEYMGMYKTEGAQEESLTKEERVLRNRTRGENND